MQRALVYALLIVVGMRDQNHICAIDTTELHHVHGGMRQWAKSVDNSQLTAGLQAVMSTLDSLKNQAPARNNMLMMLVPLFALRNRR